MPAAVSASKSPKESWHTLERSVAVQLGRAVATTAWREAAGSAPRRSPAGSTGLSVSPEAKRANLRVTAIECSRTSQRVHPGHRDSPARSERVAEPIKTTWTSRDFKSASMESTDTAKSRSAVDLEPADDRPSCAATPVDNATDPAAIGGRDGRRSRSLLLFQKRHVTGVSSC